ncbi:YugN family protein [Paenibacillus thalictri]|uniref:YugN-like family protein n=1 Tax=Paenibacillus thalictri TaxID=2527873 RepID=A0A4Q9DG73_9BACL|nr:YugN family protein [Paenibacillus thalictri]TBL70055.1 hypothetical protein EYB31_34145 [Paenibacillus thalictri]
MQQLNWNMTNTEKDFASVRHYLDNYGFSLGGNWDYDHGYFDCSLDDGNKVWLRIPFQVTYGALDGDTDATDAVIQLGTPFVLKHVYQEGKDPEAHMMDGGLMNQFQEPADKDAPLEDRWVSKAKHVLTELEQSWPF